MTTSLPIIEEVHVCPYCGDEVECEPTEMCCGEVHGEWQYRDADGNEYTQEQYESQMIEES